MRAIRSANTRPEILIRQLLHAAGYRFRLHRADLPGKPDIVLPRYRTVIFVHGCFWHGHDCKYSKWPKTRAQFWQLKISGNQQRDLRNIEELKQLGWHVIVIWECAVKQYSSDIKSLTDQIGQAVLSREV